jgi:hypothetical protein
MTSRNSSLLPSIVEYRPLQSVTTTTIFNEYSVHTIKGDSTSSSSRCMQHLSPTLSPSSSKATTGDSDDDSKMIHIDSKEMERLFIYPQPEAAKRLGVSLSTLKRRFYETHQGKRWPYSHFKKILKKRNISYIVHSRMKPTKQLDPHTLNILKKAFNGQL